MLYEVGFIKAERSPEGDVDAPYKLKSDRVFIPVQGLIPHIDFHGIRSLKDNNYTWGIRNEQDRLIYEGAVNSFINDFHGSRLNYKIPSEFFQNEFDITVYNNDVNYSELIFKVFYPLFEV